MSERELGERLLRLDAAELPGAADPRVLTWKILDRDRRRVRLLGVLSLILWLLGAGGVAFTLVELGIHVPKYFALQRDIDNGRVGPEERQRRQEDYLGGFQIGLCVVAGSVAALALAALFTFLLVLASRRATLRQVNASLIAISEQLKELRQATGK
jgi:hypothetical protein